MSVLLIAVSNLVSWLRTSTGQQQVFVLKQEMLVKERSAVILIGRLMVASCCVSSI